MEMDENMLAVFQDQGLILAPSHIVYILTQLGYCSFQSFANSNLQNMSEIEDDVRLTLVNMSKWESMSGAERQMIVGLYYIDRPQMFRLNSGEKCNLRAAALIVLKIILQ